MTQSSVDVKFFKTNSGLTALDYVFDLAREFHSAKTSPLTAKLFLPLRESCAFFSD